jgi:hypothetical protein
MLVMTKQVNDLDPVILLAQIETLQNDLWLTAIPSGKQAPLKLVPAETKEAEQTAKVAPLTRRPRNLPPTQKPMFSVYPGQKKGRKTNLDEVWPVACEFLETYPTVSPKEVEKHFTELYPGRFRPTQFNTIRDKVLRWRDEHGVEVQYKRGKTGRRSNIDLIWSKALEELEREPLLSQRKLLALMMERLPGQVKKSQLSSLAVRLKQWRSTRYQPVDLVPSALTITIIQSEEALPAVPEIKNQ